MPVRAGRECPLRLGARGADAQPSGQHGESGRLLPGHCPLLLRWQAAAAAAARAGRRRLRPLRLLQGGAAGAEGRELRAVRVEHFGGRP